jgi:hypothetical protein
MKNLDISCPENSYIDSIKKFGFLYDQDKRVDGLSEGESICYWVTHPYDDPLVVEAKKPQD